MARGRVNARRPVGRARRMSRTRGERLSALVSGALPLLLARVPWAAGALPVLGLWNGPLGALWLALAGGVALAPRRQAWPAPGWRPDGMTLFGLAAAVYLTVGLHYVAKLQASGDEPHYLLMAQSLWREHDLDLRDNLERGDYQQYTPGPLLPHYGAPRPDGRPFPAHGVGLPLALAPAFALGGRRLCAVLIALAAAALALQARALAERVTGDPQAALFAWATTAGPPLAFYSFHIYTEVPSGLAAIVSLRLLLSAPGPARAALAAILAGALPWLHPKMIPAAAALGLVAVFKLRGRPLAAFLATAGLGAAAFLGYYQWIYEMPTPLALYGGRLPVGESGPPMVAALGLLLDRSFGLLPHAPVFLLCLAAAPLMVRQARSIWPHALLALAILAPVLVWRMWWGGQCPPARFLVPLLPFLGLAVGLRLARGSAGLARWRWLLLGGGLLLALFMAARPERLMLLNRGDRPTRVWSALSGEVEVARYLPSLVRADAAERRVALLWLAALALLVVLDGMARAHERLERWFRGLELPLLLALALGAGVDAWARRTESVPPAGAQAASKGPPSSWGGAGSGAAAGRWDDRLDRNRSVRPRIMKPQTTSAAKHATS